MAKQFNRNSVNTKANVQRGLNALLPSKRLEEAMATAPEETVRTLSSQFAMLPLEAIYPNPDQPRKEFAEEALNELKASIEQHGIIQPLTVRHLGDGTYQIISGERRYRASKLAKVAEVPAFIRTANDQTLLEMALVENIQRQDLTALEVGYSYHRLVEEFKLTHEALAERVGKSRVTITHYLNLLNLSPVVQRAISERQISVGIAKAIGSIHDLGLQELFLKEVLAHPQWNVRNVEAQAKTYQQGARSPKSAPVAAANGVRQAQREEFKLVEQAFKEFFGTSVKIMLENEAACEGFVRIDFKGQEVLHHLYKAVE